MAERRTIGDILLGFGRVTEEDVERALQHQEEQGGYFGEALLALGLVTEEELEWTLASQFDLPYVFPDPESIDPEAASLVTPEWALAHLTLPIMQTAETLTVVVDSPIKTEAVDELQHRTDREIELALASASKIRGLIRQVYAKGAAQEEAESHIPTPLRKLVGAALDQGASRLGISVRGQKAMGWYNERGTIRRRLLSGEWRSDLASLLHPPLEEQVEGRRRAEWSGRLNKDGITTTVDARYLSSPVGFELVLRPVQAKAGVAARFPAPPKGFLAEVQLLARSGSARFIVTTDPEELGAELLPYLSHLLLDPAWRALYLSDRAVGAMEEVFALKLPEERADWEGFLEDLRSFHFDAVCADVAAAPAQWLRPVLDTAASAFLRWDERHDRRRAQDAGVKWEVRIEREADDRLEWRLQPLTG